jgi:hypothetical protein
LRTNRQKPLSLRINPQRQTLQRAGSQQHVISRLGENNFINRFRISNADDCVANIPYFTTMAAGTAAVDALEVSHLLAGVAHVRSLQEWHARASSA